MTFVSTFLTSFAVLHVRLYNVDFFASDTFFCVEVLRPSQPNGGISCAVSFPNHTYTGQVKSSKRLTSIVYMLSPESIRYVTNRVNACVTAKEVGGVSSNNGDRLGESEGIDEIFVDFSVLESSEISTRFQYISFI